MPADFVETVPHGAGEPDTGPATVFLVDDNPSVRLSLCDLFDSSGYAVRCFDHVEAFCLYLEQHRREARHLPCVTVTDMVMPGATGLDLQIRLAHIVEDMPCVFISGEATVQDAIRALKGGAVDFISKPFDIDTLLDAMERALVMQANQRRRRRLEDERAARLARLAPREQQVCSLLCDGLSAAELALALDISEPTAQRYRSQVMDKLRISSQVELQALMQPQSPPLAKPLVPTRLQPAPQP